jgi:hypothetical protein
MRVSSRDVGTAVLIAAAIAAFVMLAFLLVPTF